MSMREFSDAKELSKHLAGLPFMRDQEAKLRAETVRVRRDTAKKLRAVQERRDGVAGKKVLGSLTAAYHGLAAAQAAAKQSIEDARTQLRTVQQASDEFFGQCDLDQRRLEAFLHETADPQISEFIEWCFAGSAAAHKLASSLASIEGDYIARDPITDEPAPKARQFDRVIFAAHCQAISDAIDAAGRLRLAVDVDVRLELERLRTSIPAMR